MTDLDPIALDRELANAHDDAQQWQERLRDEPEFFDDPFQFYRRHLGKSHFDELWELPSDDPLREPLLRWTYHLSEQRINHWWYTQASQLRYRTKNPLETPIKSKLTLQTVLEHVIPEGDARVHYYRALEQHSRPTSDALATLWVRKQEIRESYGLDRLGSLVDADAYVNELAHELLTLPVLSELKQSSMLPWLSQGTGLGVADAMPSRLTEANLADWFRDGRLLEDLPLGSWALPKLLVPATFFRGLEDLGRRFRIAAGPRNQPFVIARDPFQLEAHAMGYCFASLLLNPSFVERRLGLGRKNQIDYLRSVSKSLLLELAQRALKVTLRAPALRSSAELRTTFQERVAEHFGPEPHPNLALVLFRLREDDAQRLLGAVLGLRLALDLREQHDEDWFRNPRAIDQLRSQARLAPRLRAPREEAFAALGSAGEWLARLLQ